MCFEGLKHKVRETSVDILHNSLRYRDLIRGENVEDYDQLMREVDNLSFSLKNNVLISFVRILKARMQDTL